MKITSSPTAHHHTTISLITKEESKDILDFEGEAGSSTVRYEKSAVTIFCGLGDQESITAHRIRTAAARGIQRAADLKREKVSLMVPVLSDFEGNAAELCAEGALLGVYKFDKYKSEKKPSVGTLELIAKGLSKTGLQRIETICTAVSYARDLVNENADVVTPAFLASEMASLGREGKMKTTILDEKAISRAGMGLMAAVGRGSPTPPRLAMIEYQGAPRSKEKTAIVGKGITFDSGGQNLKPTGSIELMREDMAGAAAVLGIMRVLSVLKPKINVVGVIAAAHNAIDGQSYFPGDILTSLSGKTVEIWNTDAEGRLVLADAITYCIRSVNPTRIIDLATLTGGILTALGEYVAGLFSNNDALANRLFTAGEATRERLWRFPLYEEYRESMKGDLGDLRNTAKFKRGYASSITGAAFIGEFVEGLPWAHLDIAGVAYNESEARGEVPKHATGFGVRLLYEFLTQGQ